jgi:hypothetical protein
MSYLPNGIFSNAPPGYFSSKLTPEDIRRISAAADLPSGGPQGYQEWRSKEILKRIADAKAAEAAKGKGRRRKTGVKKSRGGKKKTRRSK